MTPRTSGGWKCIYFTYLSFGTIKLLRTMLSTSFLTHEHTQSPPPSHAANATARFPSLSTGPPNTKAPPSPVKFRQPISVPAASDKVTKIALVPIAGPLIRTILPPTGPRLCYPCVFVKSKDLQRPHYISGYARHERLPTASGQRPLPERWSGTCGWSLLDAHVLCISSPDGIQTRRWGAPGQRCRGRCRISALGLSRSMWRKEIGAQRSDTGVREMCTGFLSGRDGV